MLLNVRSIAVGAGVVGFFAIGLIGWCSGFLPFTCCKRALAAAIVAYVTAAFTAKAINAILINAIIKSSMNKLEEKANGSRD